MAWFATLTLVAGCGSTPSPEDDVPLPAAAELANPDGPEGAATETPVSGAGAAPAAVAPTEHDAPTGPPRWFPPVGTVVRLAGISPRDMLPMLETRTVRAGGFEDQHEVDVEVTAIGGREEDVARETYIVSIRDDEVRVALAPDPLRRVPGPAREVPRTPVVGQTWNTPAGHCRVEAVGQEVDTFVGTRTGCVRIRVTSPTGRVTFRWFDPELGEIRREVLTLDEKMLAGWALCGPEPPSVERCREVLLEGI